MSLHIPSVSVYIGLSNDAYTAVNGAGQGSMTVKQWAVWLEGDLNFGYTNSSIFGLKNDNFALEYLHNHWSVFYKKTIILLHFLCSFEWSIFYSYILIEFDFYQI